MAIKLIIGGLFCISFMMHIIFIKSENIKGCYYTKPLLMPLLAIYYTASTVQINKSIILALVFAFIGDVFLMWPGRKNNFIFGLGAFLLGHLCYVLLFSQDISFVKDLPWQFYLIIIMYAMVAFTVMEKLKNHLGDMKIPTYIYMAVILLMSFVSLSRMWVMGLSIGSLLPFIGSLLFLCSDSMLGFYTFKGKFKNGGVYIMITYVLAQVLIVGGYLY
ncbi:lysoplasmalogenase [Clostridium sp.]